MLKLKFFAKIFLLLVKQVVLLGVAKQHGPETGRLCK